MGCKQNNCGPAPACNPAKESTASAVGNMEKAFYGDAVEKYCDAAGHVAWKVPPDPELACNPKREGEGDFKYLGRLYAEGIKFFPEGESIDWNDSTYYCKNSVVLDNNRMWFANSANINKKPSENPDVWTGGVSGDVGPRGPAGLNAFTTGT